MYQKKPTKTQRGAASEQTAFNPQKTKEMKTENKQAYLHFVEPFTQEPNGPRLTIETQFKQELLWWQKQGLMYTATGYGRRIPTSYKVLHNGRWKRVYCCIYSNSGTCYIEQNRKPVATVDIY